MPLAAITMTRAIRTAIIVLFGGAVSTYFEDAALGVRDFRCARCLRRFSRCKPQKHDS
jgi:hypothetical protein